MMIIATILCLAGAWGVLSGLAASMSDAPSDYAGGGRDLIAGSVALVLGVSIFGFKLFAAVAHWMSQ